MVGHRISWLTLDKGTRVVGSDDEEIGSVAEIEADQQQGIFSGIAVSSGLFSDNRFVPADLIEEMTTDAVRLGIPASEADHKLERYS